MSVFNTWYHMDKDGIVFTENGKNKIHISAFVQRIVGTYDFNVDICVEDRDELNCVHMSLDDFKHLADSMLYQINSILKTKNENHPKPVVGVTQWVAFELVGTWTISYDNLKNAWVCRVRGDLRAISSKFISDIQDMLSRYGYMLKEWRIIYHPIQEFVFVVSGGGTRGVDDKR